MARPIPNLPTMDSAWSEVGEGLLTIQHVVHETEVVARGRFPATVADLHDEWAAPG